MRYVKFLLVPEEEQVHPLDERVAADPDVERRAIHHFNILSDETAVALVEFSGDPGRVEALSDRDDIVSYSLSESQGSVFTYLHFRPAAVTERLYTVPKDHELVVDMPIRYTDSGAMEVTAIGELDNIRSAISDMPRELGMRLLRTGDYAPEDGELFDQLTPRQQETLRAAVRAGYYQEPREVTYQEVAAELDLSAGTVGEHLRKAEAAVLSNIVPAE